MDALLAQRFSKSNGGARRRSACRHFDHGVCLAALRAINGAKLRLQGDASSVKEAARATGSCPPYVQAAITLLQGDNVTLTNEVLTGHVGLLEAARRANGHVNGHSNGHGKRGGETLAQHILRSPLAERAEAAREVGVDVVWDTMISPIITTERAE